MKAVALWRGKGKSCAKKNHAQELRVPLYRVLAQDVAVLHGASPVQQKPGEIKVCFKQSVKMPCQRGRN